MAFRRIVRYVAISVVFAAILAAHSSTQAIEGRVTDTSGAVVAGAKVTMTNLGTGVSNSVVTNTSGNYTFNLVLVEVSANAALLPTENANAGGTIENRRIIELPLNGRNVVSLAVLVPGLRFGNRTGRGEGLSGFPIPFAGFSVSANGIRETFQAGAITETVEVAATTALLNTGTANVAGTSEHDWLQGRLGLPNSAGKGGSFHLAGNRNSLHCLDRGETSIDRERAEVIVVIQSVL